MRSSPLTKNRFTTDTTRRQQLQDDDTENIIFISYRRTHCDMYMARRCAEVLEEIDGLHYWLDEDDECMQHAHAENNDLKTALCIEQGLDVSSALLGIIGPHTFSSPWIPYEIGGARGRQRYAKQTPQPLIAHLIHDVDLSKVPAFVGLGTPLTSLDEVKLWGEHLADHLQKRSTSFDRTQRLRDIYKRNTRSLKTTQR